MGRRCWGGENSLELELSSALKQTTPAALWCLEGLACVMNWWVRRFQAEDFKAHTSGHPKKMEALPITLKISEVVFSLLVPWSSAFSDTGLHGSIWIPCSCGQNGRGVLPGERPQFD